MVKSSLKVAYEKLNEQDREAVKKLWRLQRQAHREMCAQKKRDKPWGKR